MYRYTRNPNYLGEVMIYAGFGLLVKHYWTYFTLAFAWGIMFNLNMFLKDHDSLKFKVKFKFKYRKDGNNIEKLQIDCYLECLKALY